MDRSWRDSATVICAAPVTIEGSQQLQYLITKRSGNHPILGGSLCFPGGTFSQKDMSQEWLDYFSSCGVKLREVTFMANSAHQPVVYRQTEQGESNDPSHYSKEISLRITAIRELFEECGILLCSPALGTAPEVRRAIENYEPIFSDSEEMRQWQFEARSRPDSFLQLCKNFAILPNLMSLTEWSNWLTPAVFKRSRFNAIFYIAILPRPLPTVIDPWEVEYAQWSRAEDVIRKDEEFIPTPQFYEMSRLKDVQNVDVLRTLGSLRLRLGMETWSPSYVLVKEELVACLPGDIDYKEEGSAGEEGERMELLQGTANAENKLHRIHLQGNLRPYKIITTAIPRFGHWYSKLNSSY